MKISGNTIGTVGMAAIALTTLGLSMGAYAQSQGADPYGTGLQNLLGPEKIATTDARFLPTTMAVINDPSATSPSQRLGKTWFTKTFVKHAAGETTVFHETCRSAMRVVPGTTVRPMTPGELVVLQALFQNGDASRARRIAVSAQGLSGDVTAKELGLSDADVNKIIRSAADRSARASKEAASF